MPAARPRVLFVSGLQIHPPLSGGNLRSYALAGALAHHGLEVRVHSLVGRKRDYLDRRPSGTQRWPDGIEEYVDRGWLGFAAQFGSYALDLPPLWLTARLRAAVASPGPAAPLPFALREALAWCDVVVADFPFVHPVFQARSARAKRRVLSTHNLEHHMYDGRHDWRAGLLRAAVRKVETRAASLSDLVVACCAEDAGFLARYAARPPIVVPNGVDVRRFAGLAGLRAPARRRLGIPDGVMVLLFTASKWGPNREAFEFLRAFATSHAGLLSRLGLHILVVGGVCAQPVRQPGFTATGKVEQVEPYFAAADVALNPMWSGAGTNVKMAEFLALRLPILTTPFGARGFRLQQGRTAFLFERDGFAAALSEARRLFDEEPARLRAMAAEAYADNEARVDMRAGAAGLVAALEDMGLGVSPRRFSATA